MTDPQHLASFVPRAYQELLGMIERGERERENEGEKKEVDLQMQFPFDLSMNEQETSLHNPENYETTKR
jgi:hypothetical protein